MSSSYLETVHKNRYKKNVGYIVMLNRPLSKKRLFHAQLPIAGPLCA